MGNIWGVHHDPDVWGDPDVFRPSRFLDENGKICQKEEWIPFSIGKIYPTLIYKGTLSFCPCKTLTFLEYFD